MIKTTVPSGSNAGHFLLQRHSKFQCHDKRSDCDAAFHSLSAEQGNSPLRFIHEVEKEGMAHVEYLVVLSMEAVLRLTFSDRSNTLSTSYFS